jgi:putative ABC transport system permease protein
VLALLLAAIGVYGLTAAEVAGRWRDVGVRLALGATRQQALWTILRPGVVALAAGISVGLVAAMVAAGWMRSLLHGVQLDPPVLLGVPLLLIALGLAAASLAAVRLLRADPSETLRRA